MALLVKVINGLPYASCKTRNGVPVAVIKAIDGLDSSGGGGSFLPSDLTGLKVWLKADAITGLVDGDPVASWLDSSGTGNAFVGGGTNPIYKTGIYKGATLPTVRFSGTFNSSLWCDNAVSISQPDTIFIVVKKNGTANGRVLDSIARQLIDVVVTSGFISYYAGTAGFGGTTDVTGALGYVSFICAGASSEMWWNGLSQATGNPGTASLDDIVLGSDNHVGVSSSDFNGDICEVIIYDSALSGFNRGQVETYLAAKWI